MDRRTDDHGRVSGEGEESPARSEQPSATSDPGPAATPDTEPAAAEGDPRGLRATAWTVVVAVGLGLAGPAFAGALVVATALGLGSMNVSLSPLSGIALTLFLTQIVGFGSVIVGYAFYRGYTLETLGVRTPTARQFALIVVGGVGTLAVALLGASVMQALAIEGASNQAAEVGIENPEVFLLLIPAAFLVIGPCEEGLFRGIVQRRLREGVGPMPAITIAGVLFAAVHVVALTGSTSARLATIVLLLIPGLIFGAIYEYTDNLVVVAGMHGVYDALIFGVLYLVAA